MAGPSASAKRNPFSMAVLPRQEVFESAGNVETGVPARRICDDDRGSSPGCRCAGSISPGFPRNPAIEGKPAIGSTLMRSARLSRVARHATVGQLFDERFPVQAGCLQSDISLGQPTGGEADQAAEPSFESRPIRVPDLVWWPVPIAPEKLHRAGGSRPARTRPALSRCQVTPHTAHAAATPAAIAHVRLRDIAMTVIVAIAPTHCVTPPCSRMGTT